MRPPISFSNPTNSALLLHRTAFPRRSGTPPSFISFSEIKPQKCYLSRVQSSAGGDEDHTHTQPWSDLFKDEKGKFSWFPDWSNVLSPLLSMKSSTNNRNLCQDSGFYTSQKRRLWISCCFFFYTSQKTPNYFVMTWISRLRSMFLIPVRNKVDEEKNITCDYCQQNLESYAFMLFEVNYP